MIIRRAALGQIILSVSISAVLAGCAATPSGSTVEVMPGPGKSFATFQSDNTACKTFSTEQVKGQADAANQRTLGVGLLTTVLGTGLGAATGGLVGDAGGGAAVGAAAGAGGGAALGAGSNAADQAGIQQQYDLAFSQCMYSRGNQVPGYRPVAVGSGGVPPDPTVRATQSELNRLGYLSEPADGYAGGHTRSAIASFEQANGLPVDGAASSRLLAKLQSTPTNASAAAAAPSKWVAPTDTPGGAPSRTTAASSTGWVAPAKPQ